jgi:hypothetical protein
MHVFALNIPSGTLHFTVYIANDHVAEDNQPT